jgi:hypothetical protein
MSTLAEHLDRLQAWLRELPGAPTWSAVRIVESASIQYGPVDRIPRDAICTVEEYERRFEAHVASGYSWINLSGLGVDDGALLVSVEVPRDAVGVPHGRTSVNVSGPALDPKTGTPIWHAGARIRIVDR